MRMTTEEAFVKVLQMHGIDNAFGIIGSAFMPISDLFPHLGQCIDDIAVVLLARFSLSLLGSPLGALLFGVHVLGQLVRGLHQRFGLGIDRILVIALDHFFGILQRGQ